MSSRNLAFEQIYASYHSKIQRYLIRMMGEYEAEDLTHEVFVRIFQSLDTFRGESELSTWIYRIATNAAFDRLRDPTYRLAFQNVSTDVSAGEDSYAGDTKTTLGDRAPMVENQVFRNEMNDCILGYVNRLSEPYRMVILLSEIEGLSNRAIAEILDITLDTVKIRLHRARGKLKAEIAANCGFEWVEGNEFLPELKRSDAEFLEKKGKSQGKPPS